MKSDNLMVITVIIMIIFTAIVFTGKCYGSVDFCNILPWMFILGDIFALFLVGIYLRLGEIVNDFK